MQSEFQAADRPIRVGIDASRNRSGGARAHLIGLLREATPDELKISEVHVWAPATLLADLPDRPWIVKHQSRALQRNLAHQLVWQAFRLKWEATVAGCDVLFTTDASTLCRFSPMVVLSQDMLSYEPGVMRYFGIGLKRLRLEVILRVQNWAFRFAKGTIFLTQYAAQVIQNSSGPLTRTTVIPHGVNQEFAKICRRPRASLADGSRIECVYVSNTAMYKHQWHVVDAVARLRAKGFPVHLRLIGGGEGRAQELLEAQIRMSDPGGAFVEQLPFLPHSRLARELATADIFIFASSCENLPVTLLEGMASGIPIACSARGPMPEVLASGGVYFDPESPASIATAVEAIIVGPDLARQISENARRLASEFTWSHCSHATFKFIADTVRTA